MQHDYRNVCQYVASSGSNKIILYCEPFTNDLFYQSREIVDAKISARIMAIGKP